MSEARARGVNRRDFLRLRVRGGERMLELSCQSLYMRYVEAHASGALAGLAAGSWGDTPIDGDPGWSGEPPTAIAVPTAADLLADLERRLVDADTLQVSGREWLIGDFGREVGTRIAAFASRGGSVE